MRGGAVGILVLAAGCNALVGVRDVHGTDDASEADAPAADGPSAIDAPLVVDASLDGSLDASLDAGSAPTLLGSTIPLRVAVGDTVPLSFAIGGRASATVSWQASGAGGSFQPAASTVVLDAAGHGTISVQYTAPATAGDLAQQLRLTDGASRDAPFTVLVRTLTHAGHDAAFTDNAGLLLSANFLYGQSVTIDQPMVLMRFGVISQSGGYNGRMALYGDATAQPANLIASSALEPIAADTTELRAVTPIAIAKGTYWIMGNFDASAPIKRSATDNVPQAYVAVTTSSALPPAIVSPIATDNRVLNFYVMLAP